MAKILYWQVSREYSLTFTSNFNTIIIKLFSKMEMI